MSARRVRMGMKHGGLLIGAMAYTMAGTQACGGSSSGDEQDVTSKALNLDSRDVIGEPPGSSRIASIVIEETVDTRQGSLTFVKYLDESGNLHFTARDASGNLLSAERFADIVAPGEEAVMGARLEDALQTAEATSEDPLLTIMISTATPVDLSDMPAETLEGDGETGLLFRNGEEIGPDDLKIVNIERAQRLRERALRLEADRAARLDELSRRENLGWSKTDTAVLAEIPSIPMQLRASDVARFLKTNRDLIAAMEIEPDVATVGSLSTAMQDTFVEVPGSSVDLHSLADSTGAGIGVYMTETKCPAAIVGGNYLRLAGTCNRADATCQHANNVAAILRTVTPQAYIYCRGTSAGLVVPSAADLAGTGGHPAVRVTSLSAGATGQFYSTRDRDWDNLDYFNNILSVVAAGNLRSDDGGVTIANDSLDVYSPAKGRNQLTVGNYDDATDAINTSVIGSSYRDPLDIGNAKPELSAPGTDIVAGDYSFTGTSQAAPHVAGMAAGLLTAYPQLEYRPWLAKAWMMMGAQDTISGGYEKVGVGGADYWWMYNKSYSFGKGHYWNYDGIHSDIAVYDGADGVVDNIINANITLQSSYTKVTAVLVWHLSGTQSYNRRLDFIPIGLDLDLEARGPNGSSIAISGSRNNSFETVSFDPAATGNYNFKIHIFDNQDATEGLYAALILFWLP